jgi:hypothetical protein
VRSGAAPPRPPGSRTRALERDDRLEVQRVVG